MSGKMSSLSSLSSPDNQTEDDLEKLPTNPSISLSFKEKTMFDSIYPSSPAKEKGKEKDKADKDKDKENKDKGKEHKENFEDNDTKDDMKDVNTKSVKDGKGYKGAIITTLIATLLFFLLQLPFVDNLLGRWVKTDNYKLGLKCLVFAVLFFVLHKFSV